MNHLYLSSFATERDLRLAIVDAGRICYNTGLMHANTGNISMRLGNDRVVITPTKISKSRMEPDDLLVIDMNGAIIKADAIRKRNFSVEAPLHLEIYRQRVDVRAVIYAHPTNTIALSIADIPIPDDVLPEVLEDLGPVPTTRFSLPDPSDNAEAIRDFIKDHNAIIIRNHGAISFGTDLEEALNRMELLESVAKTIVTAHSLGKINRLPDEMLSMMRMLYRKKRS